MKYNNKKIIFIFLILIFSRCLYAENNIHFIRLNTDKQRIELGDFNKWMNKKVTDKVEFNNLNDVSTFKKYFSDRVTASNNEEVLFFIHCMWGSNNTFVKYQVNNFADTYIKDPTTPIKHIFYILWDTRPATYGGNMENCLESTYLLNHVFNWMNELKSESDYNFNLMCHSMGNKMFIDQITDYRVQKNLFNNIILAAPDVNENVILDSAIHNKINFMTDNFTVLYNKNDIALHLSKRINNYQPLGLNPSPQVLKNEDIEFIDCSYLLDNRLFEGSLTGHLYYSTSETAKRKIKSALK